jgi:hypothetical protein
VFPFQNLIWQSRIRIRSVIDPGVLAGANRAHSEFPGDAFVEASMNLKVAIAAALFVAIPAAAYAQQNGPPGRPPKPTMADVQKLVQTINSDKAKLRAYCEFGKVMEQMDRAGQGKDTNALKALSAKANGLAQQLGPDYTRIMQGLNDIDPNSAEGKRLDILFEPIVRQCNKG